MNVLQALRARLRSSPEPIRASEEADGSIRRRALIAVCSAKHSPGATTLALALAAAPPASRSLLVDADPAGGDLALRLGGRTVVGLSALLGKAHRGLTVDAVSDQCQWLALGPALLACPVDQGETRAALVALVSRLADLLPQTARRCVCDCGRLETESPALALAIAADAVVWVMRHDKAGLEHTRRRLQSLPEVREKSVIVLSGPPTRECDPYERESLLDVPIAGTVPFEPRSIELLLTGSRRWEQTRFGSSVKELLAHIATRTDAAPLVTPQDQPA